MIAIFVTLLILIICWYAPFPIMVAIVVADWIFPDPIAVLDEIGLLLIFFSRLKKVLFIWNFTHKHKVLTVLLLFTVIFFTVCLVRYILGMSI